MTRCVTFLERLKNALGAPPEFRAARVSLWLMGANVAVFLAQIAYSRNLRSIAGMSQQVMLAFGANQPRFIIGEHRFETWVTSCFLHWSLIHIAFNVYALRQVGPFVERTVGAARFLSMYVVSGLIGAMASTAWGVLTEPDQVSAGASGAICGVIGTALVLGGRVQGWWGPLVRSMGFWLALTLGIGWYIGADNAAHIGGAVTGAIFAAAWRRGAVYTHTMQRLIIGTCAGVVIFSGAIVAARDLTDPWATIDAASRLKIAQVEYRARRCAAANTAIERAARLAPRDPEVLELKGDILEACAR